MRENHQTLNYVPTLKFSFTVDSRDNPYYPSSGFVFKQYWGYTGGILFGSRNFNKSITAGEVFFELFDVPVTKEWNYRNVLAIHSSLQFILPQFGQRDDNTWGKITDSRTTSDLLYIDGWTTARGWPLTKDLECVWDNWIELRMPIAEKYLWADTFFSATAGFTDYRQFGFGNDKMGIQDFRFSFGVGIRSVIQMLPIGFYIVKRFKLDENWNCEWQAGPIDPDGLGLNFVISFNQSL